MTGSDVRRNPAPGRGAGARALSTSTLLGYAAPAVIGSTLSLTLQTFAAPFWVTEMGLSATAVGAVFGVVRIFDLLFDPVFGAISDQTRTRWGRRRPWFVAIAPFLMAAIYLFLNPPHGVGIVFLGAMLVLVYMGWSIATVTHMALGMELTSDYRQRNRVSAMREYGVVFGILATLAVSTTLELVFHASQRTKISAMGDVMIVCLPLSVTWLCLVVREPLAPARAPADFLSAWRGLFANGALRRIILTDFLLALAQALRAGLYVFVADKVFHLGGRSSSLLLVQFITGFVGIELWTQLAHRYGRRNSLLWSTLLIVALSPGLLLIPHGKAAFWPLLAFNAVAGLSFGAPAILLRSMLGDVVDREAKRGGRINTGAFFSFLIMTQKLGQAVAIAALYPLLDFIGFNAHAGVSNNPAVLQIVLGLFALAPMALSAIAALILWLGPADSSATPDSC